MHPEAHAPAVAVQIHADYLASFQRMQTQFGNGNTDGINTYDPNSLALKVYAYGSALNSGGRCRAPCSAARSRAMPGTRQGGGQETCVPMEWCVTPCCWCCAAAVITGGSVQPQGGNTYTMVVNSVMASVGDYFNVRACLFSVHASPACCLHGGVLTTAVLPTWQPSLQPELA